MDPVWTLAIKNLTVQERGYLIEHEAVLRAVEEFLSDIEGRDPEFTIAWDQDLQLMRRTCEADMYVPASSHDSDHTRLGHAEEVPWMFMFLSRDQELDDQVPSSETGALPISSKPTTKER
eukprot:1439625-Alexandrium_andersonii.AAC.1